MSKLDKFAMALIRWPILWGSLASLGFYAILHEGYFAGEFSQRYFQSHPVVYVVMTMFFIGMAALLVKGLDLFSQFVSLDRATLGPGPAGGQKTDEVDSLSQRLKAVVDRTSVNYLPRRLFDALDYVRRKGSADGLDEHLRYSSDLDAARMQSSYALVRIIIWAIPILGFLGTVIGITLAIAQLNGADIENSLPSVVHGLKIAFDTTALALALSIILMFSQFIADRFETQLLEQVDDRAAAELVGRFEELGAGTDPQAASVRRMAEAVIASSDRLVERQAKLWRGSLDAAQQQWTSTNAEVARHLETSLSAAGSHLDQLMTANTNRMEKALAGALAMGLKQHATALTEGERQLAEQHYQHWSEVQQALNTSTEAITTQHSELVKQGEILKQVIDATADVKTLEQTLNENLAALSTSHNFEETVLSLSAALQLLSAQLHATGQGAARVELHSKQRASASNAA